MALQTIIHNKKQILLVDYTHCKNQNEMIQVLDMAAGFYRKSPEKLRVLSDFTDTYASLDFMTKLKAYGKELGDKTDKAAVLGIDGLKQILLKGFNVVSKKPTIPFNNKMQALNYLSE